MTRKSRDRSGLLRGVICVSANNIMNLIALRESESRIRESESKTRR